MIRVARDDGVATLTLDRPEAFHAFDDAMVREMRAAFEELLTDDTVRVLVITGSGRSFCAGGDVRYMQRCVREGRIDDAMILVHGGTQIVRAIRSAPIPVIAAVNGAAVGGGASLAFACDLRFASEHARFHLTYANLGLAPAWGGAFFLPRLAGRSKALELLATGAKITGREAADLGLVDRVVAHEDLPRVTKTVAREIAARPRRAIALLKEMSRISPESGFDAMLDWEERAQRELFGTGEVRRALDALVEKLDKD